MEKLVEGGGWLGRRPSSLDRKRRTTDRAMFLATKTRFASQGSTFCPFGTITGKVVVEVN